MTIATLTPTRQYGPKRTDSRTLFFQKVFPEPNTGCWIFGTRPNASGYSMLDKRYYEGFRMAHRFSYFIHHGSFDLNLLVLHRCDCPACVNPDHLFLGTNDDNMADMVSKKRSPIGERNAKSKLTEGEVVKIRKLRKQGTPTRELSTLFNLSLSATKYIINGKSWAHLPL